MFCRYQNLFFEVGALWSRAIIGEAGAEIFYLQPEPKKNIWSRSQGKMARLRNNGYSKILSGNIWHELEPK